MRSYIENFGRKTLAILAAMGRGAIFVGQALYWLVKRPLKVRNTLMQMEKIGVESLPVVMVTGVFTGMVITVQTMYGFNEFSSPETIGMVVGLSMTRELGPVLTGLIITGRVGAAMTAELGSMRVTEQISALETLAVNPIHYLVVPRLIAAVIMVPALVVVANFIGILGAGLIANLGFDFNLVLFYESVTSTVSINDLYSGIIKAFVFGAIIALTGCYKGFYALGGAEGVGDATTESVVVSFILILVLDYYLTVWMY